VHVTARGPRQRRQVSAVVSGRWRVEALQRLARAVDARAIFFDAMSATPPLEQLELLGHGPAATGAGGGWWLGGGLLFRCVACGDFLSDDPGEGGRCACGAMSKDPDAGRLGSRLGDAAIAVYRRRSRGSTAGV
jgi:hypothetical protein